MVDEASSIRNINWREVFPFTLIFRSFRVAIHPSKLVLALVAGTDRLALKLDAENAEAKNVKLP